MRPLTNGLREGILFSELALPTRDSSCPAPALHRMSVTVSGTTRLGTALHTAEQKAHHQSPNPTKTVWGEIWHKGFIQSLLRKESTFFSSRF